MAVKILERFDNGKVLVQVRRNGVTRTKVVDSFHKVESNAAFGKRDCKLAPKLKRRFVQSNICDGKPPAKADYRVSRIQRPNTPDESQIGRKERTQIACENRIKK